MVFFMLSVNAAAGDCRFLLCLFGDLLRYRLLLPVVCRGLKRSVVCLILLFSFPRLAAANSVARALTLALDVSIASLSAGGASRGVGVGWTVG